MQNDLTAKPAPVLAKLPVAAPCGGCGETDPDKRCIGCAHPFVPVVPA